ncbi:MAG TPA: dihydrodipicolinate reductase C-terminal domain-containing protein [Chlamydiales bacterium]|nr:dihydrodipicolinate reductase C-terminal domain-containing protein [Chlamydiales bacterium]
MSIKIGLIGAQGRLGRTIAALHPILPITRTTPRVGLDCDIFIDVSAPSALLENLSLNKPIVIGTTGHLDFAPIERAAKYLPIFYAPNFSLGIALLRRAAAEIARNFPCDIDLIESHHATKKDAPSGTALQLAKIAPNVHIHSIRSGKIIGEHTLLFNTAEERITLSHETHSRDTYARGALAAAHFLVDKPPGLYTMDNLFT